MGPPGHAAGRGVGNGQGTRAREKLHDEPEAEDNKSRNLDDLPEEEYRDEGQDTRKGIQQKVGSQDTGDSSARAYTGNFDVVVDTGVDEAGTESGQ